jgi:hypothetical protein
MFRCLTQYSPGRFFLTSELKLLLAYVVMNYDVEPLAKRPANYWIGGLILPLQGTKIRVRRRADAPAC